MIVAVFGVCHGCPVGAPSRSSSAKVFHVFLFPAISVVIPAIGLIAAVLGRSRITVIAIVGCSASACRAVEPCGNRDVCPVVAVIKADGLCGLLGVRRLYRQCVR